MASGVGKKKDVEEFERGFNSGGPSLSDAWKNIKGILFRRESSPAQEPSPAPSPSPSEEEERRRGYKK